MRLRSLYATFFSSGSAARRLLGLAGILILALGSSSVLAQRQDLQLLRKSVASFLETHYAHTGAQRVEVKVRRLDSRLNLAKCEQSLELTLNDPQNNGGSVSVHSRCQGPQPWSIYVPAQVDLYRPVVIAGRNLTRGTTLTPADLDTALKNTSLLRQGFVDAPESVMGMELRRPLKSGEPLRAGILIEPLAVNRGDEVRLQASAGGISVSARGTAMSSGRVGEQIRVKNDRSQRIVKGTITAPGEVKTLL